MTLEVTGLRKTFPEEDGGELVVLDGIDLTVEHEEFFSIMGPSGCGKSTFLNILAGVISMEEGTIAYKGETVDPDTLPIGYVFQEPRLLNWRTVAENITFAMRAKGVPEELHDERIDETLAMVGLADVRDQYPLRLSVGMRQRVGIARALSIDPEILLMDEPFSALDELTARRLRSDLIDLWRETEKTIIFVTHNISEAIELSDRIAFFDTKGQVFNRATIDTPRPRAPDDPAILETEAQLMETFFEHMESIEAT